MKATKSKSHQITIYTQSLQTSDLDGSHLSDRKDDDKQIVATERLIPRKRKNVQKAPQLFSCTYLYPSVESQDGG